MNARYYAARTWREFETSLVWLARRPAWMLVTAYILFLVVIFAWAFHDALS